MSWVLSANGHFDTHEAETQLAQDLGQLFTDAGAAVTYVSFSSSSFVGDPRALLEAPKKAKNGKNGKKAKKG